MEVEKTGIITRVKIVKDFFVFTIVDGEQFEVLSKEFHNVGDAITVRGEIQVRGNTPQLFARAVRKEGEEKRKQIVNEIERNVVVLKNESIIKTHAKYTRGCKENGGCKKT